MSKQYLFTTLVHEAAAFNSCEAQVMPDTAHAYSLHAFHGGPSSSRAAHGLSTIGLGSVLQLRGKTGSPHKGDGSLSASSEETFDALLVRLKTSRQAAS